MSQDADLFLSEARASRARPYFESSDLLKAVDVIDKLRDFFNDTSDGGPPQVRTDILNLHQYAMRMCNGKGSKADKDALLVAADDIDATVFEVCELAGQLETIMDRLRDFANDAQDNEDES